MPGMCSVPGCKGYKKARSRGVVFHSLPTRDPGRCRKWLKAIHNPKFDENTSVSKYGNIRVCSQHFKPEDYEPDIQAELMKTTPRKILKSGVVPTVFSGRQQEDHRTSLPANDRGRTEGLSTSSQASFLGTGVDTAPSPSLPIPLSQIASSIPSQPPLPAELSGSLCSVASVDRLKERFRQETELSSTVTSKSDENTEKDLSQSKTIVNDSCLMELFKKCQTCGQPITKNKVSHCGAQTKVWWSCLGGHKGIWMSSPHLWEAFPEIHLLTTLSVLFSGGTFTHFKKWAKHLHLNFMGHKTFFEIQKAYLNPEMKPMNRTEQEQIFAKSVHKRPEGILLHISDPLKKMKAKSRRREKGALSLSYEKRSPLLASTEMCLQEPTALSSLGRLSASEKGKRKHEHRSETTHVASEVDWIQDSFEEMEVTIEDDEFNSVKNRLSDLTSDMENVEETTEPSALGAADSCDEDVYVPIIPQRSKTSELLLECEEEELEPWQKHTLHVHLKEETDVKEEDVGELNDDQLECKPDPSPLQNWSAGQHTLKPEANGFVHTSEVHQISNNPVSLSSVQSPEVCATSSNQLQSEQSNSQTLSVPLSLPCLAEVKLESTGTSDKHNT
ncbi:hypothetical protein PFLUV_G00032640 [Perca fluviatilis]|uniref:THAP-type domain-containing protein n=1 Tax=Perca fluviatilis TaxID=8168 RepID=A0A6A5EU70_PERFL|nr:uncharacterized protein LOC120556070 isoform X2 [Perca fluviatilis]KAF1392881.1 hypothetical protein PFLUV_G00032640 [Perca fluviatilis]